MSVQYFTEMGNQLAHDSEKPMGLLSEADGAAVEVVNALGAAPIVLMCEHASARIPESLHDLGLTKEARNSHIAWDPGSREVAVGLSHILDAPLVASRISRLVYDCNRPPDSAAAFLPKSELFAVPGNQELSEAHKAARISEVYRPFVQQAKRTISNKHRQYPDMILVTIHSFTPVYNGKWRDVELGILHDDDHRFADAMLHSANGVTDLKVRRNEPYGPADGVTHSLKIYGQNDGLLNVMIEISNELLKTPEGINGMIATLNTMITRSITHAKRRGV